MTVIKNARIITASGIANGSVAYSDGIITEIPANFQSAEVIDARGAYLSAGFIDLHTHGVYDAAMMMALSPLSEESIAKGGAPVMMPDFTKGRYLTRKPLTIADNPWSAIK